MRKKVVFHLSGVWDSSISIMSSDVVYRAPDIENSKTFKDAKVIVVDPTIEKSLCDQYAEMYFTKFLDNSNISSINNIVYSFLNDYYSYSVRPVFSLIHSVVDIAKKYEGYEVVFLSAKSDTKDLPMFGFKTTESSRGSRDLIGALVSNKIKKSLIFPDAKFKYLKGDIYCKNYFRIFMLGNASRLFSALFILKTLLLSFNAIRASKANSVVVVRNKHHARFAKNVMNLDESLIFFLVPQLTQGKLLDLLEIKKELMRKNSFIGLSFSDLYEVILEYKFLKKSIKKYLRSEEINRNCDGCFLKVSGFNVHFSFNDMLNDLSRFPIFLLYKSVLTKVSKKYSIERIINFELVGRMAGIEAWAAKDSESQVRTIQTALISSRPHPVFPYSDFFYSESEKTKELIKEIGSHARGVVDFVGVPYKVSKIKECKKIEKIVFYTQPYDCETTLMIVKKLLNWVKSNAGALKIKLHPRDSLSKYSAFFNESKISFIDLSVDSMDDLFNWADVSVTRTSSVAKESIASGCPVILCLWSDFDKNIKSDYIDLDLFDYYISTSEAGLVKLLDNPVSVSKANLNLHSKVFGDKEIFNLVRTLNEI